MTTCRDETQAPATAFSTSVDAATLSEQKAVAAASAAGHDRQAEQALAEFIHARQRHSGPRDPSQILITDFLADYAQEYAPETAAPWRLASAAKPLVEFWHEPYKSKRSLWM